MEVEGRDGKSVYNSIWIASRAEEMSLHKIYQLVSWRQIYERCMIPFSVRVLAPH